MDAMLPQSDIDGPEHFLFYALRRPADEDLQAGTTTRMISAVPARFDSPLSSAVFVAQGRSFVSECFVLVTQQYLKSLD
jgi:hypothetical protein